jgi:hypothetical protein
MRFAVFSGSVLWLTAVGILMPRSPLRAADADTQTNVYWAVWHEGCRVFGPAPPSSPFSDKMNSISTLRQCAYNKQSGNVHARDEISNLSNDQLAAVFLQAEHDIPATYMLAVNFDWVCHHEGQLNTLRQMEGRGDYEGIRQVYFTKQQRNPNAKNLLNAVTNKDIKDLLDSIH